MSKYNDIFITVIDQGLDPIPMTMESSWNNQGNSIVTITSDDVVPKTVELRTLLYPSGANLSQASLEYLLDRSNFTQLSDYIRNSGYYFNVRHFYDEAQYQFSHVISHDDQNDYYNLAYSASAMGETSIFQELVNSVSGVILTKPDVPEPSNISVEASLVSTTPDLTSMLLKITHKREINNYELSDPDPYKIFIFGKEEGKYFEPDGTPIPIPGQATANNYFPDSISGMFLTLPYTSGVVDNSLKKTYEITMVYFDQENEQTPPIIFDTDKIKETSDQFEEGELEEFINVKAERVGEIPIKKDTVLRKRLAIGVEDFGVVNELFAKEGQYVSEYYNLDDPLYTFFFRVGETIPDKINVNPHNVIRYYVQFNNQDWIRFSPINRINETDEDGDIVPKFFVLDDLNIGHISTEMTELKYDFPVYSFRIKIELDMSFMDNANFISPSITYYECHVTDRNSFMRIE